MSVTKKNVVYKYKQGNGWIVGTYDTKFKTWVLSHTMSYWQACARCKLTREQWDTKNQSYRDPYET